MNTFTETAKAIFFIENDENAFEYQASVISYKNSLWIVATWFSHIATNKRIPDRIVPLALFHPAPEHEGLIRLGYLMPRSLLSVDCSLELLKQFDAETFQVLELPHLPGSNHLLGDKTDFH